MDKLSLPCDCAGTCSVALVTEYEEYGDEPQEFFVEFYVRPVQYRLRDRVRYAWRMLRKATFIDPNCCLSWSGPEQPEKLRDFLNEKLPQR